MAPWLLFPVITQGDQIIDNLSINWMRAVVHVLLGLIFGIPVAVVVAGVARGRWRRIARVSACIPAPSPSVPGLSLIAAGRVREGQRRAGRAADDVADVRRRAVPRHS